MKKILTKAKYLTQVGSPLSIHLVALTGKHYQPIHPKHLIDVEPWFLKFISLDDAVLDLGSGNGQVTLDIATVCKEVIGVEKDDQLRNMANAEAKKLRCENVKFIAADLEKSLPFDNSLFNIVVLQDVVEHVYKDVELLLQVKRVLKRNGQMFLTLPNRDTSWKKEQRAAGLPGISDKDHKREYVLSEVKELLGDAGFEIAKIYPGVYDTWMSGFIDLTGGLSTCLYKHLCNWKQKQAEKYPEETNGWRIVARMK